MKALNAMADPVLLFYVTAAIFCMCIAIVVGRKRDRPLTGNFALLMWLEFAWSLFLILRMLSPEIDGKVFWDSAQFPVSLSAGITVFRFAREIVGAPQGVSRRRGLLLYVPAAIGGALAFTDRFHGLIRSAPRLDSFPKIGHLVYGFTSVDYILFAYSYALAILGICLLLRSYYEGTRRERRKYRLVILGLVIPMAGILPLLLNIRLFGRRDLIPIWFVLGSLPIFVAIFRYRLFDIMPLARQVLVESLGDPIFVFDAEGRLLDCNHAFSALLDSSSRRLRGRSLSELLSSWPEAERRTIESVMFPRDGREIMVTIVLPGPAGDRSFQVNVSAIPGEEGERDRVICKVALLRDVTELAGIESQLRAWNDELEGRIASRISNLEMEVSRRKAAEEGLRRVSAKMVNSQREILVTLSDVVENRSPETANHVLRVAEYSRILAAACGLSPEGVNLVTNAAALHDVGKIAVPDSILNKAGTLTDEERALMKTHTIVGYRILGTSERSLIRAAAVIALEHHEYWNGTGYPAGKAGNAISLSGRITCVCDVFDALSTSRSYKEPWEMERIRDFFKLESGGMFDPVLVEILFANENRFLEVAARYPEARSAAFLALAPESLANNASSDSEGLR